MNIQPTQLEKAVLLTVTGRMDAKNAEDFQNACQSWIALGTRHLIADLEGLQYVSSMGLRSFLMVAQELQSKSGALLLCRLHGLPLQVFQITRLLDLFRVYETPEQANAAL